MSWMLDLLRAAQVREERRGHVLTDDAVMHAVNLGAMVHNLLATYEHGIGTGEFTKYRQKMYDLSVEFHKPEAKAARETMRQEWVRRVEEREQL